LRELRVVLALLLVVVLSACGGGDTAAVSADDPSEAEATIEEATAEDEPEELDLVVAGVDDDVFCPALDRVTNLLIAADGLEVDEQVDAQVELFDDVQTILVELGEDHEVLSDGLELLATDALVFTEDAAVDQEAVEAASQLAIETWNVNCADHVEQSVDDGAGDPDPSAFGADGQEDEFDAECPSPETLEAEGLECDEFGNLYPAEEYSDGHGDGPEYDPGAEESYDAECPSPETLEAEGLACDEYGNTYPAGEYSDGHGDEPEYDPDFGGDGCEGEDCYGDEGYGDEPDPEAFGADGCEGDDC
jgi:hypothetical protein